MKIQELIDKRQGTYCALLNPFSLVAVYICMEEYVRNIDNELEVAIKDFVDEVRFSISCCVKEPDFDLSVFRKIKWDSAFQQFLSEHIMISDIRIYRSCLLALICLKEFGFQHKTAFSWKIVEVVLDNLEGDEKFSSDKQDIRFALGY